MSIVSNIVTPVRYSVGWFDAVLFGLVPVVVALILFVRHKAKQRRDEDLQAWDDEGDELDDVDILDSTDEIDEDYDTDVRPW